MFTDMFGDEHKYAFNCSGNAIKNYKEILFRAREEFQPYDPEKDDVLIPMYGPNYTNKYHDWNNKYSDLMYFGDRMVEEGIRLGVLTEDSIIINPNVTYMYHGYDENLKELDDFEEEYKVWKKTKDLKERKEDMDKLNVLKTDLQKLTAEEAKAILVKLLGEDEIDPNATKAEMLSDIYAYCKLDKKFRKAIIKVVEEKIAAQNKNNTNNSASIEPVDDQEIFQMKEDVLRGLIEKVTNSAVPKGRTKKDLVMQVAILTQMIPGFGAEVKKTLAYTK